MDIIWSVVKIAVNLYLTIKIPTSFAPLTNGDSRAPSARHLCSTNQNKIQPRPGRHIPTPFPTMSLLTELCPFVSGALQICQP